MVLLANETWHDSKNRCKSMRDDIFGIFGDIWGLGPQTLWKRLLTGVSNI
jgi:hypothetical protein